MQKNQAITVDNRLLNLLPINEAEEFINECDLVELKADQVLATPGKSMAHAYFPLSSVISWEKQVETGAFLTIMLIGYEGMLGFSFSLVTDQTTFRAIVQKEGFAWRLSVRKLKRQLQENLALLIILKRYTFIMINQLVQIGVCNLFHVLECRLAKIFLMLQDRANSNDLHITQESLAQMLGVRRVGVTKAASAIQRRGIISYSRGHVSIIDIQKLQQQSCNCYELEKAIYEEYLIAEGADNVHDTKFVADVQNVVHMNLNAKKGLNKQVSYKNRHSPKLRVN